MCNLTMSSEFRGGINAGGIVGEDPVSVDDQSCFSVPGEHQEEFEDVDQPPSDGKL